MKSMRWLLETELELNAVRVAVDAIGAGRDPGEVREVVERWLIVHADDDLAMGSVRRILERVLEAAVPAAGAHKVA